MEAGRDKNGLLSHSAILPGEIKQVRDKTRIGQAVRILDKRKMQEDTISFGVVVTAKVASKYPHFVVLDNGLSVSYAQLARYIRAGRKGYIKDL